MDMFASSLDALADWRRALDRRIGELSRFLGEQELLEGAAVDAAESMRQRVAAHKLVVAFVAEFSRGKSEPMSDGKARAAWVLLPTMARLNDHQRNQVARAARRLS